MQGAGGGGGGSAWGHRIGLALVVVALVYRRWLCERDVLVTVPAPRYTLLHPGVAAPPAAAPALAPGDYERLIDLTRFQFTESARPCGSDLAPDEPGPLLVVIVCSNPINFENRRLIRATWGRETDAIKLVFLIGGTSDAAIERRLVNESLMHGDFVRGNFADVYRNLTYKHVMGLKWVTYHCPNARYVLKSDDDVFVNSNELRRFLTRELSPWGARGLIACHLLEHARVQRSFRSKWRVSPAEYPDKYYPPYCTGWVVLYSADVIRQLYVEAQRVPYFWIDDVHVTGVLAKRIGFNHTPFNRLVLSDAQMRLITSFHFNPIRGAFLFGPPDLSVSLMKELWNTIQ